VSGKQSQQHLKLREAWNHSYDASSVRKNRGKWELAPGLVMVSGIAGRPAGLTPPCIAAQRPQTRVGKHRSRGNDRRFFEKLE
jgi:hypothetical protein